MSATKYGASLEDSMYVAILAGGVGSRLWPRSRRDQPKQFSDITGTGRTMLQATVDRLAGLVKPEQTYIVTGASYAALAAAQLPDLPPAQILAEPCGRNTAPAIGLACLHLRRRNPQAILMSLHSDHVIADAALFQAALRQAVALAHRDDYIVTLGIEPTFPHTGYGYIQRADSPLEDPQDNQPAAYAVRQFLEKPNQAKAQAIFDEGGYYWNAGMFICRAQTMLNEIERQTPDLFAGLLEIDRALESAPGQAQAVMEQVWPQLPNLSIDHGIMEGATRVAVVPLATGWNDVGSWDALEDILHEDGSGNIAAAGDLVSIDSNHNIIYARDKVIALIGVENLVIVDTGDAILVGQKQQMQRVKDIVDILEKTGRFDQL